MIKFKTLISLTLIVWCSINTMLGLTLQDAVLKQNKPKGVGEIVVSKLNNSYYMFNKDKSKVEEYDFSTGKVIRTIFDSATARDCTIELWEGFSVSADEKKLMLYTASDPIYRNSFSAEYYTFDIARNWLKPLSTNGKQQVATMSPDGRMVAFVRDNNVYVSKLDYGTEIAATKDGAENLIINGIGDWVNQEELNSISTLNWSDDNMILSFISYDESEVNDYTISLFADKSSSSYKYPQPGTKVSKTSVVSYDVDNRVLKTMDIPMADDDYIPMIKYANGSLMVLKLNRIQNRLELYMVNPKSKVAKLIYSEDSKTWISIWDITDMIRFNSDSFIIPSKRDGFTHLYQYGYSGALIKQVTSGNFEVTDYYGYDAKNKAHYFQSTADGAINRSVYKLNDKGEYIKVTDNLGTNSATFNNSFDRYVLDYSDITTPNIYTLVDGKSGKVIKTIEDNVEYATKYTATDIPTKELFKLEAGGVKFNAYIIKPLDFNPNNEYPVIMSQYSGVEIQKVLNEWSFDWEQYAATQGYIIISVDGRGTGGRGSEWEDLAYMQLGKYESMDQVLAAKEIAKLPYVDAKRIGIYGWSYGGYNAIMSMSTGEEVFAAGVAIAPLTDWRLYDAIYAERYMRTPQQNENGYILSSAIENVTKLNGNLLIIAGTADDNVHIDNSYNYATAATANNKIIDMMIYPDMNHSINEGNIRYPLYLKVLDYFRGVLKTDPKK
ncbi:MAG: DPP IV N-terminal domain-containing protein [Bacteroidales bacterium]